MKGRFPGETSLGFARSDKNPAPEPAVDIHRVWRYGVFILIVHRPKLHLPAEIIPSSFQNRFDQQPGPG